MDFFAALFEPTLLPFTVCVLAACAVWGLALLGLFDFEAFDLDLDLDADLDADVDADLDLDADAGGGSGGLLHALGLGMIPVSLTVTLVLFVFGLGGLALHRVLEAPSNLLVLPVALAGAVAVSAVAARGLRPLFQSYGAAQGAASLVGKVAVVGSSTVSPSFGTATLTVGGSRAEVAVRTDPEETHAPPRYGERVLLYDYDAARRLYFAAPYDDKNLRPAASSPDPTHHPR